MSYPSTISAFTNPSASNKLNSPSHSAIETAQNNELVQIETVIGTDSSILGTIIGDLRNTTSSGGGHIQSANKGGTGQTAYTKGDILIATSTSVLSKFAVGSDAQILAADSTTQAGIKWIPNQGVPTVNTLIPLPVLPFQVSAANVGALTAIANPSSMLLGQVHIPFNIVVNKVTIVGTAGIAAIGTMDVTMYSESGASSVFSVTTSVFSTAETSIQTTVPGASVASGVYYIGINPNQNTASIQAYTWNSDQGNPFLDGFLNNITGKPVIQGIYTIASGTPPASIVVSSILAAPASNKTLLFRLDT